MKTASFSLETIHWDHTCQCSDNFNTYLIPFVKFFQNTHCIHYMSLDRHGCQLDLLAEAYNHKAVILAFTKKRLKMTRVFFHPVGPLIKAEVGEQIVITFKNKASRPYSITAHGVKASGAHVAAKPGKNQTSKNKYNPCFCLCSQTEGLLGLIFVCFMLSCPQASLSN